MEIRFLEDAELELAEAVAWYAENDPALGTELRVEIEATVDRIIESPLSFPTVFRSNVRRILTDRFPYSIFFRVIDEKTIVIISVFHNRRNPIIWQGRIVRASISKIARNLSIWYPQNLPYY